MKCENNFCIYCDNYICILDNISLDVQGRCMDCILISLEPTFLQNQKEKLLCDFENRYKDWKLRDK